MAEGIISKGIRQTNAQHAKGADQVFLKQGKQERRHFHVKDAGCVQQKKAVQRNTRDVASREASKDNGDSPHTHSSMPPRLCESTKRKTCTRRIPVPDQPRECL